MRNKKILTVICMVAALTAAGCGKDNNTKEITPTPVPTAAPTPAPATATPLPTSTPAPRLIGSKTSTAKFVYLTNSTGKVLREIYVKVSGGEEWGRNLIPSEASVKASEQVQMYYAPGEQEEKALYDMKIITDNADIYEIYNVDLEDMKSASLRAEEDSAYIRYMSLSAKKEMDTKGSSSDSEMDEDDSSGDYDNSYNDYQDSSNDYNENYGGNDDDGYDGDYGGDGSTDDGNDDGTNPPSGDGSSSGDDGGTDDGSSGDDDTSDGGDDGSSGGDIVWDENGGWTEN
ncbi:MAG: hypothetical protein Q4D16_11185 [Eubacteriales bacterium]|nr:hypothetical protein [Eubacteriales bacterium]